MFCSSCGKSLNDEAKFCDGCGKAVVGAMPTPIAVTSSVAPATITAKTFKCDGCGAPLKIPDNSKGRVTCPSCKNECVIDGLVKNAEMAAKENINSGISLTATPATLHRQLVNLLCESDTTPVDVFEKAEIVREERYCVPAYCFYCSGSASFTYEVAKWTTHKTAIASSTVTKVEKEQIKDYAPMSGMAAITATRFSSGNRELAAQVNDLYLAYDSNQLVDYEYLEFPNDVVTCDSNFPQTASFNEYVKPNIEGLLNKDAEDSLSGKDYRSLQMGGSKVDKDETLRVFLGVYRVVYKYNNQEFSIWFSGNGERFWFNQLPVDQQRQRVIAEKQQQLAQLASIPASQSQALPIILTAGGLVLAICTAGISLIATVVGIVLLVKNSKKNKEIEALKALRTNAQLGLQAFQSQLPNAANQFKSRKQPLKGIYEAALFGDVNAF
jgi:uncharacterized Zn finger protein (UPF0148 family)